MRVENSTAKRLLKMIIGITLMTMSTTLMSESTVFAVTTATDPQFSKPFLNDVSQLPQVWTNAIPNALASYYTYIPFSAADAETLGFPNAHNLRTAANPNNHVCGGTGSNGADCYIISVRQFRQPTSLDFLKFVGITLFPGNGLLDAITGLPLVDTTTVDSFLNTNALFGTRAWGYGSGGANWQPYYSKNITTVTVTAGNAPAPFQSVPFNSLFGPGQNGDPNATGVWHFPAPTIKGTKGRPVYVQWLNDLPNTPPVNHDPTVDCGANAPNCYPYNRIVTHVHGAHVFPESDGLATAWYTPNFGATGLSIDGAKGEGTNLFTGAKTYAHTLLNPTPIYYYPMDQEAGTIWYHDHAIGTTHLNTDMGMAGFFPVTDAQETALRTVGTVPSGDTYELGFALQDRNFDTTGQMIMPDYAIYDKTNLACTYLDAPGNLNPDPTNPNCVRANFLKQADKSVQGWHFIPDTPANRTAIGFPNVLNPTSGCVNNANQPFPVANECAPFGATSASLEYFGNIPVVNGVTYGVYNVSPGVYRMRFIGGTDSRTWLMQLQYGPGADVGKGTVIPFWQIASEQGLFNAPVQRTMLDLMGGERFDVLVDFNVLADANGNIPATRVFLKDLGEDAPYGGGMITDPAYVAPNTSSTPDIMVFDVALGQVNYNSPAPSASLNLRPTTPLPALKTPQYTRTIALVEITDAYGRTMPTVDTRGYRPAEMPISENILQNQIEQWDIVNTTVDAHPMHLHQVAFQLINRQYVSKFTAPVDGSSPINHSGDANFNPASPFVASFDYRVNPTAAQTILAAAQYAPAGAVIQPQAHETLSMKDTVDCPPSYVTRIITKFDILGTYVWHCHILSHEEHDMMRPYRVVAAKLAAPIFIIQTPKTDANGKVYVLAAPSFTPPVNKIPYKYLVQYRKRGNTFWHTNPTNILNPYVDLRKLGTAETADLGPGTYDFRVQVVNQILQDTANTNLADSNWTYTTWTTIHPATSVTPASLKIQSNTQTSVNLVSAASSTPGAAYEFQYSLNGGLWTSFGAATAASSGNFALPTGMMGTFKFQVIVTSTTVPDYTASAPRVAVGSVVIK
jgi:spore coat protein A